MQTWVIDFETYYNRDFTLKKLTTEAYIRDPRFEVLGAAIRHPSGVIRWFEGQELTDVLRSIPWHEDACLAHHAQFDGLILSHHYGVTPHAWFDTLSMARLLVGNHLSAGLESLAGHFGLPPKSVPYGLFQGKHWSEVPEADKQQIREGCCHDVALTWDIFCRLLPSLPLEESKVIDLTIRMFTEPMLIGNIDALIDVYKDEVHRKDALLAELQASRKDIRSNEVFAALLREEGVEPEMKAGKNGPIFAFAATDEFMKDLRDDQDDRVRSLVEARISCGSAIDETRARRLAYMASRGRMAVYLSYAGAHTTRWSGGDKVNWQNFRRRGAIREAIESPPGHKRIKADKSQIECRYLNMLAGQWDVIERFRRKEDPYIGIASKAYGHPVYKPAKGDPRAEEMEIKRGTGKQLELSCGYGAGSSTIVRTAARGTYGPPVYISEETGRQWRDLYRAEHPAVCSPKDGIWAQADWALRKMHAKQDFSWSVFKFVNGTVILPNGCPLHYPQLHWHVADDGEAGWRYMSRRGLVHLWGGSFTENLIQAVARVDMSQTLLRIQARAPWVKLVNLEHDAAIGITLDNRIAEAEIVFREEFTRAPVWCPEIPLDCDISVGSTYG